MKKYSIFLFIVWVTCINNLYAQTTISGGSVEGTWRKSNSPYIIEGAIFIPNSKTLDIEPGVRVEFQGSYKFLVLGELNAVGKVNDSIVFTSNNHSEGWLGIRFENTSNLNDFSNFSYCKFEHGRADSSYPLNKGGAFFINRFSKVKIKNCLIENCYAQAHGGGIYCDNGSSPLIENSLIRNNTSGGGGGGIYAGLNCNPVIKGNFIRYNITDGSGGGIYTYNFNGSGSPVIENNRISHNVSHGGRGGGIRVMSKSALIRNNIITFNEASGDIGGGGLYLTKSGTGGSGNAVTHNIISNNKTFNDMEGYGGGGIYWSSNGSNDILSNNLIANNTSSKDGGGIHFSDSNPLMINNTIVNNNSRNGAGLFCKDGSSLTIKNSIIWGNVATNDEGQIFLEDEESDPNIYYNDIEGGESGVQSTQNTFYFGEFINNIDLDPLFNVPSSGIGSDFNGVSADWTLNSTEPSPCINRVVPNDEVSEFDLNGSPRVFEDLIDMGCYEAQDVVLNVIESNYNRNFSIYPNPSSERILFEGDMNVEKVVVYNLMGEIIKVERDERQIRGLDISDLHSGVYLIQINNKELYKIIKVDKRTD